MRPGTYRRRAGGHHAGTGRLWQWQASPKPARRRRLAGVARTRPLADRTGGEPLDTSSAQIATAFTNIFRATDTVHAGDLLTSAGRIAVSCSGLVCTGPDGDPVEIDPEVNGLRRRAGRRREGEAGECGWGRKRHDDDRRPFRRRGPLHQHRNHQRLWQLWELVSAAARWWGERRMRRRELRDERVARRGVFRAQFV